MDQSTTKISLSSTAFIFRKREVFLLGTALLAFVGSLVLALVVPEISLPVGATVGILLAAAIAVFAMYRVKGYFPLEVWLVDTVFYRWRNRNYVKGGAYGRSVLYEKMEHAGDGAEDSLSGVAEGDLTDDYWIPGFSNAEMLMTVTALTSLALGLVWIGPDNVRVAQSTIRSLVQFP